MTHWLLKPWRIGCLIAGLVVPAAVILVASVWYAPGVLRWDPPNPGAIAAHYRDAMNDADAGDLEAALQKLEALRATDAFNGLVHAAIADVQDRADHLPEAIAAAQAAVAADPMLGEAWYNLGCYLIQADRAEAGLVALHNAVAAGFDARQAGRADPDLEPIAQDPRWTVYREGADMLPLEFRTASFQVSPATILEGDPFAITLMVFSLNRAARSQAPPVSVEYLGPEADRTLTPLEADSYLRIVDSHHARHFVWTFRYRLKARKAMARRLGPWEIQLGGVRLSVASPNLVIQPGGSTRVPAPAGQDAEQPVFRPRAFFRIPLPVSWQPGATLSRLPSQQVAWSGGMGVVAAVCGSDIDPSSPPQITWQDKRPVRGHYDLRIDRPDTVRCAARVFVVSEKTAMTAEKKGVRVNIDATQYTLTAPSSASQAE